MSTHTRVTRQTRAAGTRLSTDQVWRSVGRGTFAVIGYVTPTGAPRSAGVLYTVVGHRMYVITAVDSWKARHIAASGHVTVTVPIRRGGPLAMLLPIPPATVSFHGSAVVHPASAMARLSLSERFTKLLPPESRATSCVLEIRPDGHFVTYGVGVPLRQMPHPELARARVPVGH
jgi:Pyridoxamine 5'-phosphate oxidase